MINKKLDHLVMTLDREDGREGMEREEKGEEGGEEEAKEKEEGGRGRREREEKGRKQREEGRKQGKESRAVKEGLQNEGCWYYISKHMT